MAESTTIRLALPRWTADTDTPNRTEFDSAFANLEDRAAGFLIWDSTGEPDAIARPAAAAAYDRFYAFDRATKELTVCVDTTGAGAWSWVEVLTRDRGSAAYVAKLDDRPLVSTANLAYYVDQTAGSDANDGLTAATAFATFDKAWSMVPRFLNHNTDIRIVGNYTGDFFMRGLVQGGGLFQVLGDTGVPANHTIFGRFFFTGIHGSLYNSCRVVQLRFADMCYVYGAVGVSVHACEFRNNGTVGFQAITVDHSLLWVRDCDFGTSQYERAIYARVASRVYSYINSGSMTAYGLHATGASTIGKYGTQPTGATANETASYGGVIR